MGIQEEGRRDGVANGSDRMTNIFRAVALAASVVMRMRAEENCMLVGLNWLRTVLEDVDEEVVEWAHLPRVAFPVL